MKNYFEWILPIKIFIFIILLLIADSYPIYFYNCVELIEPSPDINHVNNSFWLKGRMFVVKDDGGQFSTNFCISNKFIVIKYITNIIFTSYTSNYVSYNEIVYLQKFTTNYYKVKLVYEDTQKNENFNIYVDINSFKNIKNGTFIEIQFFSYNDKSTNEHFIYHDNNHFNSDYNPPPFKLIYSNY